MENRKIIDKLRHIRSWKCNGADMYATITAAIEALEECRWIPVTENLPEDGKEVLVYLFNNSLYVAWRSNGVWCTDNFDMEDGDEEAPVAWRPLPEPYQEDKA